MKISEQIVDEVVVLEIAGRMAIENQSELTGLVTKRIATGHRGFLVNLGDVPYCDSRGLAELIRSFTLAKDVQGQLKLVNVQPHLHKLLDTAGLAQTFPMFDSMADGLKSFES